MKAKTYTGDGKCIYCRTTLVEGDMHTEHIIPFCLDGQLIITDANCTECKKLTSNSYENKVLNNDLLVPRVILGLRSRGKVPKVLPKVTFDSSVCENIDAIGNYKEYYTEQLSVEEFPNLFQMVSGPMPGLLSGVDRQELNELHISVIGLGDYSKQPAGVGIRFAYYPGQIELFLAKIAYSYAIAELGHDVFDASDILDLILEKNERSLSIWNFVGAEEDAQKSAAFHYLRCYERDGYQVVSVKLFGSLGGPTYIVVLGKLLN